MRRIQVIFVMAVLIVAVAWIANGRNVTAATSTKAAAKDWKIVEPGAKQFEEFVASDFENSENIDNAYWPLKPGTQMIYEGTTEADGEKIAHRLVTTVTDLTRVIAGVRCRVIHEADYSGGQMIEQELAYFAQDKNDNVWHFGQYRETFEDEFVGGRIFYPGNPEGSKAGIMVPGDPKTGTPSYSEGYAPPPYMWTDRGRVSQLGQKTKTPAGSYDDCIIIEEFDENYPGAFQLKYYARGVGHVRVGWKGTGADKETLELMKAVQLGEQELEQIRKIAFEMEKRGLAYSGMPSMDHTPAQ